MSEQSVTQLQGAGIGLRGQHISEVLKNMPNVPWFEILVDNHLAEGGIIPVQLAAVRASYPITFHCIGMSIAGVDELDFSYLKKIKNLIDLYQPAWVSDHLCFTQFGQHQYHDLLPFPYTEQSLRHVAQRVMLIQEVLDRPLLIENVSSYLQYRESTMSEAEFLTALSSITGSEILLDINNAYVNQVNHNIDAKTFISSLPTEKIKEVHLAGYEDKGEYLIDAHNNRVSDAVWDLYAFFIQHHGNTPTLIEWDNDLPEFEILLQEAAQAEKIASTSTDLSANRKAAF